MAKRIIRSKKRIMKNGKRNQRKSVKRRKLKTIKGGMFKRAKKFFSKKKAQGIKTGNTRRQIGVAFDDRQEKIDTSKKRRKTTKDFSTEMDISISKLRGKLNEIGQFYSGAVPFKPEGINKKIEIAEDGIGMIQELQQILDDATTKQNETLADLKGALLIPEVKTIVETLDALNGALVSQQKKANRSNIGKALENASSKIQTSLGDPWFLSTALKTASRDYLITKDNKFSIQNLFDNYLMKNKNLTNSVNGEKILESHRDSLIVQLKEDPIAIGQQPFGTPGAPPRMFRNIVETNSNAGSGGIVPQGVFAADQTARSLNNRKGLPEDALQILEQQNEDRNRAESTFKKIPPAAPPEKATRRILPLTPSELAKLGVPAPALLAPAAVPAAIPPAVPALAAVPPALAPEEPAAAAPAAEIDTAEPSDEYRANGANELAAPTSSTPVKPDGSGGNVPAEPYNDKFREWSALAGNEPKIDPWGYPISESGKGQQIDEWGYASNV